MQKRLLRTVSVLLCLAIICSISAFAAEARASSQISVCSAVLARKSNGDLSLIKNIVATGTMDSIERYNGSKRVAEGTYTVEDYPEMQTSGILFCNPQGHSAAAVVGSYPSASNPNPQLFAAVIVWH